MTVLGKSELDFDYDEEEDILFVTIHGRPAGPAVTYETDEGHLVRLNPDTYELVGAEILGYRRNWEGKDIHLAWEPPASGFRSWLRWERHEEVVLNTERVLA